MASLHIINHLTDVQLCQPLMRDEDALLLCGDAVYALRQPLKLTQTAYALAEDVQARGIANEQGVQRVDYTEFVALCAAYAKVITW